MRSILTTPVENEVGMRSAMVADHDAEISTSLLGVGTESVWASRY